jgi:hypothetical protein
MDKEGPGGWPGKRHMPVQGEDTFLIEQVREEKMWEHQGTSPRKQISRRGPHAILTITRGAPSTAGRRELDPQVYGYDIPQGPLHANRNLGASHRSGFFFAPFVPQR